MSEMGLKQIALLGTVVVFFAVLVLGLMEAGSRYFTSADRPLQVELHYPTPLPTPVLPPTVTPVPTMVPAAAVTIRLAEKYDTLPTQANENYQGARGGFTVEDFAGHGAVASASHVLTLPSCIPSSSGAGQQETRYIYPWTRYAIAWRSTLPEPAHVLSSGTDIRNAFVVQTQLVSGVETKYVLTIDGVGYNLMVSRDRLNCRDYEGKTWALEN